MIEDDRIRARAHELAHIMTGWLSAGYGSAEWMVSPMTYPLPTGPLSDLVEWCRSARDILEAVGK
jgi:hypothetical protein